MHAPSTNVIVYVDGSSRGNPGPAGIGVVVFDETDQTKPIKEVSKYLGITTNNVAEYEAFIHSLKWLISINSASATVKLDSELIYKQLTGKYRVKTLHIAVLLKRVRILMAQLKNLSVILVPRNENKLANRLAQKASKVKS